MPTSDRRGPGAFGPLLHAPEPARREGSVAFNREPYLINSGGEAPLPINPDTRIVGLWAARFAQWRNAFEQKISRSAIRNWQLWRNFDQTPSPPVGQEWRDRTVIPQAFKEIATRVPRKVLGLFGVPEPYTIRGKWGSDEEYEETIRVLIEDSLDGIGLSDPEGEDFLVRMINALTYNEVVGHVFFRYFWRKDGQWFKTKMPDPETGRLSPIEVFKELYNNVDMAWYPVTQVAFDVYGRPRRWLMLRVRTSLETLVRENDAHKKSTGTALYPGLAAFLDQTTGFGTTTRDTTEEPRDTEHWPLDDGGLMATDPSETPVELELCYDNVERTLTKIVNRRAVLDHGFSDTPDGLDGFISLPCIPIPGRPYGESILNWTGGLHVRQTRLSRARADETMMNMFQQYLYRAGSLNPNAWFWRPGGGAPVENVDPERPISDAIFLIPRRPLPPEAYAEERYTQSQSEAVAAADALAQGQQGTDKSRDVTKAEIDQRIMQGQGRTNLELLYLQRKLVRPTIQRILDLLQMHLDTPRMLRILDDPEAKPIDLTKIQRPVDIVVGSPGIEATMAETLSELDRLVLMSKPDTSFAPWLKEREILIDVLKNTRTLRRHTGRYVRTQEEKDQHVAQLQQQQAEPAPGTVPQPALGAPQAVPTLAAAPPGGGSPGSSPPNGSPSPGAVAPGSAEYI